VQERKKRTPSGEPGRKKKVRIGILGLKGKRESVPHLKKGGTAIRPEKKKRIFDALPGEKKEKGKT